MYRINTSLYISVYTYVTYIYIYTLIIVYTYIYLGSSRLLDLLLVRREGRTFTRGVVKRLRLVRLDDSKSRPLCKISVEPPELSQAIRRRQILSSSLVYLFDAWPADLLSIGSGDY